MWCQSIDMKFFSKTAGYILFDHKKKWRNFRRAESITSWRKLFYKSNWLRRVTKMKNKRIPQVMFKCRPNGRRRLGRHIRLLDEAETGVSRPKRWWVMMMIMIMWCQNIEGIQCKWTEWLARGREAGTENSTGKETSMQDVTLWQLSH